MGSPPLARHTGLFLSLLDPGYGWFDLAAPLFGV
jgi:hypothetical protein